MKRAILILLFLSGLVNLSFAKAEKPDFQEKISLKFIKYLLDKKVEKAYQMFDAEIQKTTKIEDLRAVSDTLIAQRPSSSCDFVFFRKGKVLTEGKFLSLYAFRWEEDVSKDIPGYLVTIIFQNESSKKILGINASSAPKKMERKSGDEISTTTVPEYQVASPTNWEIDGKQYAILDISLIEFANKEGMLAIKVEYDFNKMDHETAQTIGIPFAKMAFQKGMLERARLVASQKGMTLTPEIGIALVKPKEFAGFRTRIEAKDYQD